MATGSYSCQSNWATISDVEGLKRVLKRYNTNNQLDISNGKLQISSPSDTINIYEKDGSGTEVTFLEEISVFLGEELRLKNIAKPPRQGEVRVSIMVAKDGEVEVKTV